MALPHLDDSTSERNRRGGLPPSLPPSLPLPLLLWI